MKVVFAGGGTAGHINPAIAIANYIKTKEPNADIIYIGAKGGMEEYLVEKAGYKFIGIKVTGFSRKLNLQGFGKNMSTIKNFVESCIEARGILKKFNPDICLGTGGYVSGPVLWQASRLKIRTLIHEQNAYPGITTKWLSKKASAVMLASRASQKYFNPNKCNLVITGNPIREEILKADKVKAKEKLNLDKRPVILSFGGSLGARKINEAIADLVENIAKDDRYQVIHAFGQYGKWLISNIEERGVCLKDHKNLDIREYIFNMSECLAAADLVICRAGAISLSEIEALGKASILIPSPNVAENHQYHNAMELVNNGAAEILEEKDLTGERLIRKVDELIKDKEKLSKLEKNAKKMAIINANEMIYRLIKEP
ncbi:MAG: undecaprenyldiphospho-muramoylpentapeptide beta-N-acetylglucosaminyltransferase [Clostridia bacterium]|nr:undecaprenyldiphospho-muramoylpentapeptide beta-N-acetylglucosaminyltransferase [Clostridia bacterium]